MNRILRRLALGSLIVCIPACSGTNGGNGTGGGTGGGRGGGTGGGGGSVTFDAGMTPGSDGGVLDAGDARGDGGVALPPVPAKKVSISLQRTAYDAGQETPQTPISIFAINATEISATDAAAESARCRGVKAVGDCRVIDCAAPLIPSTTRVALGVVTVTGISFGAISIDHDSNFTSSSYAEPMWVAANQVMSVSSQGAAVPAFSAQTVRSPDHADLTDPVCEPDPNAEGDCTGLVRSDPFTVRWSGAIDAVLDFRLQPYATQGRTLECTFNGGTHTGTIDASLMELMPAGDVLLLYKAINSTTFSAGDYQVTVRAEFSELQGGRTTLQ